MRARGTGFASEGRVYSAVMYLRSWPRSAESGSPNTVLYGGSAYMTLHYCRTKKRMNLADAVVGSMGKQLQPSWGRPGRGFKCLTTVLAFGWVKASSWRVRCKVLKATRMLGQTQAGFPEGLKISHDNLALVFILTPCNHELSSSAV